MTLKLTLRTFALFTLPFLALVLFASCKKSNDTPATVYPSKDYKLYNVSSGAPVEAGTFTIGQLADGNARLAIALNTNYRVPGAVLKASIIFTDMAGTQFVYADLGNVDGSSGTGEKSPVLISSSSLAIKYTDLIAKTNYGVKVLNGGNVQAIGVIN